MSQHRVSSQARTHTNKSVGEQNPYIVSTYVSCLFTTGAKSALDAGQNIAAYELPPTPHDLIEVYADALAAELEGQTHKLIVVRDIQISQGVTTVSEGVTTVNDLWKMCIAQTQKSSESELKVLDANVYYDDSVLQLSFDVHPLLQYPFVLCFPAGKIANQKWTQDADTVNKMTIVFDKDNCDPEMVFVSIAEPLAICAPAFTLLNEEVQKYNLRIFNSLPSPAPARPPADDLLVDPKASPPLLPMASPEPAMNTAKSTAFYLDHYLFEEVIEYLLPNGRDITKLDYERFEKALPAVFQCKSQSVGGPKKSSHGEEYGSAVLVLPFMMPLLHKMEAMEQFAGGNVARKSQTTIKRAQTTINRCKLHAYHMDAIRIQYTFTDKIEPEVMYFFWDTEGSSPTSRKYLFGYQGCEKEMIAAINAEQAEGSQTKSNEAAEEAFKNYLILTKSQMSVLDPKKAYYYQLPETVDRGYWNDSAARLLEGIESPHSPNSNDKQRLEQFIHAIAKRLFLISFDFGTANIHFQHDKHEHKAVVNDEFHVILRLKDGDGLIFYTGKEVPEHCVLSRENYALGRTRV